MASLSQIYASKETEMTTKKTFLVPRKEMYIEEGFNVRDIDWQHVAEFRDAYMAGEYVPPLVVEVTERGIKLIDGHHRFLGAAEAEKKGFDIPRLECKDFIGSEADKIAFMITSSQGLALKPLERGEAYQRLVNQGWSNAEIAKKVKRSESDIIQHLQLHQECSPYIKSLVRSGSLNYALAIDINREHGVYADKVAAKLMEKAEATGKKKITRSLAKPQFAAAKTKRLIELIYKSTPIVSNDGLRDYLMLPVGVKDEVMKILTEFRDYSEGQQNEHQPE